MWKCLKWSRTLQRSLTLTLGMSAIIVIASLVHSNWNSQRSSRKLLPRIAKNNIWRPLQIFAKDCSSADVPWSRHQEQRPWWWQYPTPLGDGSTCRQDFEPRTYYFMTSSLISHEIASATDRSSILARVLGKESFCFHPGDKETHHAGKSSNIKEWLEKSKPAVPSHTNYVRDKKKKERK